MNLTADFPEEEDKSSEIRDLEGHVHDHCEDDQLADAEVDEALGSGPVSFRLETEN